MKFKWILYWFKCSQSIFFQSIFYLRTKRFQFSSISVTVWCGFNNLNGLRHKFMWHLLRFFEKKNSFIFHKLSIFFFVQSVLPQVKVIKQFLLNWNQRFELDTSLLFIWSTFEQLIIVNSKRTCYHYIFYEGK